MLKKPRFLKREPSVLGRVARVLYSFSDSGRIRSYEKIEKHSRLDTKYNSVFGFKIFESSGQFFDLMVYNPKLFSNQKTATFGKISMNEVILYIGQDCLPYEIASQIIAVLADRKKGFDNEELFGKMVQDLISKDREVRKVILSVERPPKQLDLTEGVDWFINTRTNKIPIGIRSSKNITDKKKYPKVPSFVMKEENLNSFKEYLMKICLSYKLGKIEHF